MARQTKIVNMSLLPEMYRAVDKLAKKRQISRSQLLRDALEQYVTVETRWEYIRKLGTDTAKKLGIRDEEDVDRIIHELRSGK